MKRLSLLLIAPILASCSTAVEPPTRSAQGEAQLRQLLADKVAGEPVSCLPHHRAGQMVVIDDNTLAFRDSSSRVWVNNLQAGCAHVGGGSYALVTRTTGGLGLCRGDIAEVRDVTNGYSVGACVLGEFTPYTRPAG